MSTAVEVVDSPNLAELAETITREHSLVRKAGIELIEHAILAGEALLQAKDIVPHGEWTRWLRQRFPDHESGRHNAAPQIYMRLARAKDALRDAQPVTFSAAIALVSDVGAPIVRAERIEEARAQRARGLSYQAIGDRLGVSNQCIRRWLNPEIAEQNRKRTRQLSLAARRALHREQRDRDARSAGGGVAEAYALIRKTLQTLDRSVGEYGEVEARRILQSAIARLHKAEDDVIKVSRNWRVTDA